jgi:hypothetical protein
VNVEHLLDVFTSIDKNSDNIWDTCVLKFMEHLYWHKERLVVLGPKIEGLPDDHLQATMLVQLSQLFELVGNYLESKQLLTHAMKLWRAQGNDSQVAESLKFLSDAENLATWPPQGRDTTSKRSIGDL